MWRTRMLLLKRYGRLTVEREERILRTLDAENHWGEVIAAYLAYQEALVVFDHTGTAGLRTAINGLLERLGHLNIPELRTLAATLDRWMPEIWAYFETGTTNAATEGCNRKVKQVKRVACGFRNRRTCRVGRLAGQRGRVGGGHGSDGRLPEAGLLRVGRPVRRVVVQHPSREERAGSQDRHVRRGVARRTWSPMGWCAPVSCRPTDPRVAGLDPLPQAAARHPRRGAAASGEGAPGRWHQVDVGGVGRAVDVGRLPDVRPSLTDTRISIARHISRWRPPRHGRAEGVARALRLAGGRRGAPLIAPPRLVTTAAAGRPVSCVMLGKNAR